MERVSEWKNPHPSYNDRLDLLSNLDMPFEIELSKINAILNLLN